MQKVLGEITDRSIEGIIFDNKKPEIIIDATSALHHKKTINYQENGIKIIDMTPAKLGISCCPVVNLNEYLDSDNINMISCGGRAALPISYAIKNANKNLNYIAVSTISSASLACNKAKYFTIY